MFTQRESPNQCFISSRLNKSTEYLIPFIDITAFCTSSIIDSIYLKESSGFYFITVSIYFTSNVTIHSLITIEYNADRDVKVDYYVVLYDAKTFPSDKYAKNNLYLYISIIYILT